MALNKREQIIAGVVGGALLLYIGYTYAVGPLYFAKRQALQDTIKKDQQQVTDEKNLLANLPKIKEEWAGWLQSWPMEDPAKSGQRMAAALADLMDTTHFIMTSFKEQRVTAVPKTGYEEHRFQVTGRGTTRSLWPFIYGLETQGMPIRLEELSIHSKTEGQDDLTADITFTLLVYNPQVQPKTAGGRGGITLAPTEAMKAGRAVPSATHEPASLPSSVMATLEARMRAQREQEIKEAAATAPSAATQNSAAPEPATRPAGGVQ